MAPPDSAGPRRRDHVLDRPSARVAALGVVLLVAGSLGWIHRDDLFPPGQKAVSDDPVARCFAARAADIDRMRADGVIDERQAALFKGRAEALCRAQEGGRAGPPPLPAQ